MICKNCGTDSKGGSSFCTKCGATLDIKTETNDDKSRKPSRGKAIVGFICSLCGILTCGISSIVGLILSIMGLSESRKRGETDGLAIAGIIFSSLFILIILIAIVNTVITTEVIEVADFSIISKDDAKEWCEKNDANCKFKEEYSDTIANGDFIKQSIDYGTKIKSYTTIYITYSKGKKPTYDNASTNNNSNSDTNQNAKPAKTAEEIKNEYKESCQVYGYKDIARQPDDYKGKKAKFRGKVIQVSEGIINSNKITLRVEVTEGEYGWWDDPVLVTYTYRKGENKILEDDIVNMYGTIEGTESYITVLGANVTIPSFTAKYIEIEQ